MLAREFNHRSGEEPAILGTDSKKRVRGFTLIELLISLSIMLILAGLTMRLLNVTLDSDRIKTGARELQSYLAGARDRAIYAGQPRGVRLIPDPTDYTTVRSFVYIGASTLFTDGTLINIPGPTTGQITYVGGTTFNTWVTLWQRGLLPDGTRIQLSQGANPLGFLTVSASTMAGGVPTAFSVTSVTSLGPLPLNNLSYTLQLAPAILPGEEPRQFPRNIVVDLNNSLLPASWPATFTSTTAPTTNLDIVFSPQGTVMGPVASDGRIHFVLSDIADTTGQVVTTNLNSQNLARYRLNAAWQPSTAYAVGNVIVPTPSNMIAFRCVTAGTSGTAPAPAALTNGTAVPNQIVPDGGVNMWLCFAKKPNLIVSLATATARVTTHPPDMSTPAPGAGTGGIPAGAVDSFRFSEIGEVTQ